MAKLTKKQKGALSRALSKEGLRISAGSTPEEWSQATSLLAQGLTPKAVARLMRSTLPEAEQKAASTRKAVHIVASVKPATKARQDSRARLNSQARAVKRGEVLRDAQGRILPREFSQALQSVS